MVPARRNQVRVLGRPKDMNSVPLREPSSRSIACAAQGRANLVAARCLVNRGSRAPEPGSSLKATERRELGSALRQPRSDLLREPSSDPLREPSSDPRREKAPAAAPGALPGQAGAG